jgi:uncharacterized membrane protein YgcG
LRLARRTAIALLLLRKGFSDRPSSWRHGLHARPASDGRPETSCTAASRIFVRGEAIVGKKLYCGNLSYGTSSADLETLFMQFGAVRSADVITDRDTGQSKGFGFVEFERDEDAQAAIDGLNNQQHDGRALQVNEARPREERRPGGGGGGGGGRGGYGGGGGGGGRSGGGGGGGRRW